MVNYPIFEEIKNFVYTNLESIFLVIVPLATLIGWLSERLNKKLTNIQDDTVTEIKRLEEKIDKLEENLKEKDKELEEKLSKQIEKHNEFKESAGKTIAILKTLLMRDYDFDDDLEDKLDFNSVRKLRKRNNKNSRKDNTNPS